MFEIKRYSSELVDDWNEFVASSKNGTFLFDRRYMDYHADRFIDHSLMIYRRGRLYALLPGNVDGDTFYSHQGLTYGGLLMNDKTTAADVVEIFKMVNAYLSAEGLKSVVYKPVPWIYHQQPSEEDLYAIIQVCDVRITRGLSSAISREHLNEWYRIRKNGAQKAKKAGVRIEQTEDYHSFWQILSNKKEGEQTIGGCVLYVTSRVVHSQYITASPRGRELHALDLLFEEVIAQSLKNHAYFDFGISTEKQGTYLNQQLIYQKEGFGGRGICYEWYKWTL